jgi:hypothetical protein
VPTASVIRNITTVQKNRGNESECQVPTTANRGSDLKSTDSPDTYAATNIIQGRRRPKGRGRWGGARLPPVTDVAGNVAVVPVDAQQESVFSFARDGFADISDSRDGLSGANLLHASMK